MQNGVVRALRCMHRQAVAGALGPREARKAAEAIALINDLLNLLPSGHELAACLAREYAQARRDGQTPLAKKLQHSYTHIEDALEACHRLTISSGGGWVDEACDILGKVLDRIGHEPMTITRGELIDPHNHGAVVSAAYPNGMRLELSLRRSNPTLDEGVAAGVWIIDGGAWAPLGTSAEQDTFLVLPPETQPDKIAQVVEQLLRSWMRACLGSLSLLQATKPAAASA